MEISKKFEIQRSCGSCNKCCEGWLLGQAYGFNFYPSNPCHFLCDSKCSIYENRPDDPCKSYNCEWIVNGEIPGWMKPDQINAIITKRKLKDIYYFSVSEAGEFLRSDVLSWLLLYCLNNSYNLEYNLKGGKYFIGSLEFQQMMKKRGNEQVSDSV
jgi:hypothetical protein